MVSSPVSLVLYFLAQDVTCFERQASNMQGGDPVIRKYVVEEMNVGSWLQKQWG